MGIMGITMKFYVRFALGLLLLTPVVLAQNAGTGSISGVVRDSSGAVIPGAKVEVASPALIEGSRSAIADEQGAYRIINLRPGTYNVTFSMPGFAVVRREGLQLDAGFNATENADLRAGDVKDTVTVTDTAPVVDTQSVSQDRVFAPIVTQQLPTGLTVKTYATLIPGTIYNGGASQQDVGGNKSEFQQGFMIHGGQANDFQQLRDGLFFGTMVAAGNWMTSVNPATVSQVQVQIGSQAAEFSSGGVVINVVERDGGNQIHGSLNGNWTNSSLQSNNINAALQARGATPTSIRRRYDHGGGIGGPIKNNKLWFFFSARAWETATNYSGNYFNANAHAPFPNNLFYTPDLRRPAFEDNTYKSTRLRLTYQASAKDKISAMYGYEWNCNCPGTPANAQQSPETFIGSKYRPNYQGQVTWTRAHNNRLVLEGGAVVVSGNLNLVDNYPGDHAPVSIFNAATGYTYGSVGYGIGLMGSNGFQRFGQTNESFAASYVTGSHNLKSGAQYLWGWRAVSYIFPPSSHDTGYTFLGTTPIGITQYATPSTDRERQEQVTWYVQDQWKIRRFTLSPGVRYEHLVGTVPPVNIPAGTWVPARSFPEIHNVPLWNDWNLRLGAAYDLFGNGKTAIKGFVGRFVLFSPLGNLTTDNSPANLIVTSATRTWTDTNRDYSPFGPTAGTLDPSDNFGPLSNPAFGTVNQAITYSNDVLHGNRPYQWQQSVQVEQQLWRDTALRVAYFRRSYGNFYAVQNTSATPANFSHYCVTAPSNAYLPGRGGNQICGFYDLNPAQFALAQTYSVTLAKRFGQQSDVFNGVDVTFTTRFRRGAYLQAGLATGSELTDNCYANSLPNVFPMTGAQTAAPPANVIPAFATSRTQPFCRISPPWSGNTQFKAAGVYPLPWNLQVSANYQNISPIPTTANWVASNAAIAPTLGRNLSACGASVNCTATVRLNVVLPNTYYREPRVQQLDLRFSRTFNISETMKLQPNVDLFNVFNANSVFIINQTLPASPSVTSTYNNVLGLLDPRVVRFGANFNF